MMISVVHEKQHPFYSENIEDWQKYRYVLNGGRAFVQKYLQKYSEREGDTAFGSRKTLTYCPAHAESSLIDIRNTIYQRMNDIVRITDINSLNLAIDGRLNGVDNAGNTMNSFIGRTVLTELLFMSRVGIFIDRSPEYALARKKEDKLKNHPYMYIVRTEDIVSWKYSNDGVLQSVLIYYEEDVVDDDTGLVTGTEPRYKLLRLTDSGVEVKLYKNSLSNLTETVKLNLSRIPFTIVETSRPLLKNVADYQIALLNMESSDVNYSIKSNFTFYTEQFDPRAERFLQGAVASQDESLAANERPINDTTATDPTVKAGHSVGRRYPIGAERPGFINPSPEPLQISMAKEKQIKEDIRKLINLNVSQLEFRRASAESKKVDAQGSENGFVCIGMELEYTEREAAAIWAEYEGKKNSSIVIKYPSGYDTKSDAVRIDEAKEYTDMCEKNPSSTFKREMMKRAAQSMLSNKVDIEKMAKIEKEIDSVPPVISTPKQIQDDHKEGFVSTKTASVLRGYPEGESVIAKEDQAERAARIVMAQKAAAAATKGTPDSDPNAPPDSGVAQRQRVSDVDNKKDGVRGDAK